MKYIRKTLNCLGYKYKHVNKRKILCEQKQVVADFQWYPNENIIKRENYIIPYNTSCIQIFMFVSVTYFAIYKILLFRIFNFKYRMTTRSVLQKNVFSKKAGNY